jgi:5-oxopent-3-ene-1,2,5-tricarboxylate decarboxylase / 2-hydroxyhepta-2,4-diene-1,7-dioate isomerase
VIEEQLAADLRSVQTATISYQLRKRGIEGAFLTGLRPLREGAELLGEARTLRYVAFRADVSKAIGGGMNAQKRAIDDIDPGEVLVIEARGERGAGTIGDILALRVKVRGGAGVVTDGAVRDSEAIAASGLPVYSAGAHAAVLGERHVPMDSDLPITCAGVLVMPGDILRGDADGVIVIPRDLAGEVARAAVMQEQEERFIAERVEDGAAIDGLYPLGEEWREQFEQWEEEGDGR